MRLVVRGRAGGDVSDGVRRSARGVRRRPDLRRKGARAVTHVEVQVLADGEGNVLTLGERGCSIQRRIRSSSRSRRRRRSRPSSVRRWRTPPSERAAPSADIERRHVRVPRRRGRRVLLHRAERAAPGGASRDGARHRPRSRASSSHIAAGEPFTADGRAPRGGHAIEVRLNAEDPAANFAPSPGRVTRFRPPLGPFDRLDTHVEEGTEVSPHYDSLLAKLIVWDLDRNAAIARCRRALSELRDRGRDDARARDGIMHSEAFVRAATRRRSSTKPELPALDATMKELARTPLGGSPSTRRRWNARSGCG